MVRDSTFEELFGGFGVALDALTVTQSQIKQVASRFGAILVARLNVSLPGLERQATQDLVDPTH
jgi:hypothetical protein